MALETGLRTQFESIVPEAYIQDLDQSSMLWGAEKFGVDRKDCGGVCWELCRRWVARFLTDKFTIGETANELLTGNDQSDAATFTPNEKYLQELITKHKGSCTSTKDGNFNIQGVTRGDTISRQKSGCQFTVLRSREDVLNHMYQNPGTYIFVIQTVAGPGHAFGFQVANDRILFFDPNLGEFSLPSSNETTRRKFLDWYKSYWGRYYKKKYHNGERRLTRYTLN